MRVGVWGVGVVRCWAVMTVGGCEVGRGSGFSGRTPFCDAVVDFFSGFWDFLKVVFLDCLWVQLFARMVFDIHWGVESIFLDDRTQLVVRWGRGRGVH